MASNEASDDYNSDESDSDGPSGLPSKVRLHMTDLSEAISLNYEELIDQIQELNDKALQFSNQGGRRLHFYIKRRTDQTFLWKLTIRIRCVTVNSASGAIEKSRLLSLRQFVHVYKEIVRQSFVASQPSASSVDLGSDAVSMLASTTADEVGIECCICMDNKAQIVLACSHVFCEKCINQWCADDIRHDSDDSHHTCPICRKEVRLKNDTWVLAEHPDPNEVASEATGYVMGLVERCGVAESEDAAF